MKLQTLADVLSLNEVSQPCLDAEEPEDVLTPQEFCRRILESRDFRQYIQRGIALGDLPPGIVMRLMDHGWGKPAERVEHTGEGGGPVVTEVRRVIVQAREDELDALEASSLERRDATDRRKARTH